MRKPLRRSVRKPLRRSVRKSLRRSVRKSLRRSVRKSVAKSLRKNTMKKRRSIQKNKSRKMKQRGGELNDEEEEELRAQLARAGEIGQMLLKQNEELQGAAEVLKEEKGEAVVAAEEHEWRARELKENLDRLSEEVTEKDVAIETERGEMKLREAELEEKMKAIEESAEAVGRTDEENVAAKAATDAQIKALNDELAAIKVREADALQFQKNEQAERLAAQGTQREAQENLKKKEEEMEQAKTECDAQIRGLNEKLEEHDTKMQENIANMDSAREKLKACHLQVSQHSSTETQEAGEGEEEGFNLGDELAESESQQTLQKLLEAGEQTATAQKTIKKLKEEASALKAMIQKLESRWAGHDLDMDAEWTKLEEIANASVETLEEHETLKDLMNAIKTTVAAETAPEPIAAPDTSNVTQALEKQSQAFALERRDIREKVKSHLSVLQDKIKENEELIAKLRNEKEQLIGELEEASKEREMGEEVGEGWETVYDKALSELKQANENLEEKDKEIEGLQAALEEEEKRVVEAAAQTQAEIIEYIKPKIETLKSQLKTAEEEKQQLEEKWAESAGKIAALEQENITLQARLSHGSSTFGKGDERVAKETGLGGQLQALEKKIAAVEAQRFREVTELREQRQEHKNIIDALRAQLEGQRMSRGAERVKEYPVEFKSQARVGADSYYTGNISIYGPDLNYDLRITETTKTDAARDWRPKTKTLEKRKITIKSPTETQGYDIKIAVEGAGLGDHHTMYFKFTEGDSQEFVTRAADFGYKITK